MDNWPSLENGERYG